MSDLGCVVGFEKVKAEASISERTAYDLRCYAKRREAVTSFEVGKGPTAPQFFEFSGLDDGSGSLVGTHYRTAEIGATAQAIEAHPFSSRFSRCIMRSLGDLWVPRCTKGSSQFFRDLFVDGRHLNSWTFIIPGTVFPAQGSHTQIEADMARGQNILLLGARGSGKSAIVRALGHGKWLLWQQLSIFMMCCCVTAGFQGA